MNGLKGHLCASIFCSLLLLLVSQTVRSFGQATQGDVVVRIDDTSGSHCIDASTEKVTIFVRRVFVEKNKNFFTEDKRAGVLVQADIAGVTAAKPGGDAQAAEVQVPAVDLVSVKDEPKGRVSLALEYGIASGFALTQGTTTTRTINIYMNLAKTQGKTSFGSVMDLAGQALNKLPIPPNPYSIAASKILQFANDAVTSSISANKADQIAHLGLQFNDRNEPDLDKCKAAGNERTGAIAVLRSTGPQDSSFIPTTNVDAQYCFRYSSASTYELLAAKRGANGSCPSLNAFTGVSNDYVMLLLSSQAAPSGSKGLVPGSQQMVIESRQRCKEFGLPYGACGVK